jgi:hypothetical protein
VVPPFEERGDTVIIQNPPYYIASYIDNEYKYPTYTAV